jgi:signal transduction histidine kinase
MEVPDLLDALPDPVVLVDDQRRYVDANPAACSLLGGRREDIVGTEVDEAAFRQLVHDQHGEQVMRGGDGRSVAVEFRARTNVLPGVHLAVLRPRGGEGHLSFDVVGSLVDIQREALNADVRLDEVMESICVRAARMTGAEGATIELIEGDHVVYHVATGSMRRFVNFRIARAGSLSGLSIAQREVLHCVDSEVDARVDREACRRVGLRSMIVSPLVNDKTIVGVLKVTHALPTAFDERGVVLLRLVAGLLGTAMATAAANETRRMLAERESARLQELERLRDELTALVVHDLRSPLTVIMANLEYVKDELPDSNNEAIAAAVDALRATARLDSLIRTLLETARLEQGRMELQQRSIDMRTLVDQVVADRQAAARTAHVAVTTEVEPALAVEADPELLRRLFDNIIDNAFRHVPRDGRIDISARHRDGHVQIRIGNSGPALPVDSKARVFEKFAHGERAGRRNFGLGLYFCKLVAEAHGGRIWVESSETLPAIFAFEL